MNIVPALAAGFLLDLLLGDPPRFPHIVVAIGRLVSSVERAARAAFPKGREGEILGGAVTVLAVATLSLGAAWACVAIGYRLHPGAGFAVEAFLCWQALAVKGLRDAGLAVRNALRDGSLPEARRELSRIVGRDTDGLNAGAIARAAVESVAENASDGVVAPMLYFALGGAPLAVLYKAVNTMDSMLGYKNDAYLYFGRAAARLDDAANFLPARLTAILAVAAAPLCGGDARAAFRTWRADRNRHSSPNAGQPEAAYAGALGVWLGGASTYGGVLADKPRLGEGGREAEAEDIGRAGRLLQAVAFLALALCCAARMAVVLALGGQPPWTW